MRRRRACPLRGRPAGAEARPAGGDLDDVAVGIAHVDRVERAAVEHLGARRRRARAGSRATPPARRRSPRAARSGAWSRSRPRPRASAPYSMKLTKRAVAAVEPHVAGVGIVVGRRVVDDRQPEHVAIERDRRSRSRQIAVTWCSPRSRMRLSSDTRRKDRDPAEEPGRSCSVLSGRGRGRRRRSGRGSRRPGAPWCGCWRRSRRRAWPARARRTRPPRCPGRRADRPAPA